jgi:hypothetical protein
MLLVSLAVVQLAGAASGHGGRWARGLRILAALASIGIGCWLGVETLEP